MPWVLIDSEGGFQKYIFKRDGELVMSLNGVVTIGKWEYLAPAKSLLIDRLKDKILLNQNFVDSAVMVLNQDGLKNGNFVLANEVLIPDLDVSSYIKKLFYAKNNIFQRELPDGMNLEFHNYPNVIGSKVTIEMKPIENATIKSFGKRYVVENGVLIGILVTSNFTTDRGDIAIEYYDGSTVVKKGNNVIQGVELAPDGKYRLGFMNYITVQNGRIIKTSIF